MKISPCKDCPDRKTGCHSKCQKYIEYDSANKARRGKRMQALDSIYVTREAIYKAVKKKHARR